MSAAREIDGARTALSAAGVVWATVMLHELGHAAATAALGGRIEEISVGASSGPLPVPVSSDDSPFLSSMP